jgi:arylsulfatase A-like enzyme
MANPEKYYLTRRQVLAGLAVGTATALTNRLKSVEALAQEKRPRKPNLLFVFSDQQAHDMLGCYGNESIITPNIDKFASQSVRFSHCISSQPVCSPFRGMLLSGQHSLYNGCYENDVPMLPNNGKYFAHVLNDAGYKTAYIGKWHLLGGERDRPIPAGPYRYGFDNVFLSNNIHVDFRPGKCFYWNAKGEKVFFNEWEVYGQTKQALEFLDQCTEDEPFAMFVSWHPPHAMSQNPNTKYFYDYDTIDELMNMYDPHKIKLRPNVADCPQVRKMYHGYMAMCTGVDIAFGKLIDKLKEKGLNDNTIVVFTSDHGDLLNSHGFKIDKGRPEDESIRTPLIICYPHRLKAGSTSKLLVGTLDLMPTILGLMGLSIPTTCQGKNLSSEIIRGNENAVESVPLMFIRPAWRGVYTYNYTYACGNAYLYFFDKDNRHFMGTPPLQVLYDNIKDKYQMDNVYNSKSYQSVRQHMDDLTHVWLKQFEDTVVDGNVVRDVYMYTAPHELPKGRPINLLRVSAES